MKVQTEEPKVCKEGGFAKPNANRLVKMGRPPKIDRETLVAAAIEIGLDQVTLSGLARKLGITNQTIHNHIRSREDLLQLAAAVLFERTIFPDDEGEEWGVWIRKVVHVLRSSFESAPGLATVSMRQALMETSPALKQRWADCVAIAVRSGYDPAVALWAAAAVLEFVMAWVARAESGVLQEDMLPPFGKALPTGKPDEHLVLLEQALAEAHDYAADLRFEVSLDVLIDGFDRLRGRSLAEIELGNTKRRMTDT